MLRRQHRLRRDRDGLPASAQLRDAGCSAVFLSSYINDAALIIEALTRQTTPVTSSPVTAAGVGSTRSTRTTTAALRTSRSPRLVQFDLRRLRRPLRRERGRGGSIKQYVLTAYDATTIIGKASQRTAASPTRSSLSVPTTKALGLLNFLDNGDVGGAGYNICTYSGDSTDADGGFACNKY